MIKRAFGSTGLAVSALGLGCNNFGGRLDLEKTKAVVDAAIETGVNFIDTADAYGNFGGSESFLGATLGNRRKNLILATKFGLDHEGRVKGGSRVYVTSAVEASLNRLKTDWIDVYYYHRPDLATPIEETQDALDDLVRQGKIRFPACSNLPGPQLAAAMELARSKRIAPFVAAQDHYNLLSRDIEATLVPVIARYGIALVAACRAIPLRTEGSASTLPPCLRWWDAHTDRPQFRGRVRRFRRVSSSRSRPGTHVYGTCAAKRDLAVFPCQ
jgi:aryl-alcohol dehydrogenase-like predicted oxidoreductase